MLSVEINPANTPIHGVSLIRLNTRLYRLFKQRKSKKVVPQIAKTNTNAYIDHMLLRELDKIVPINHIAWVAALEVHPEVRIVVGEVLLHHLPRP
jgi:hypothetical protein